LGAGHKGCSFLEGFEVNAQNLLQKGRPFIMCEIRPDLNVR
jgi:hypothetical protein